MRPGGVWHGVSFVAVTALLAAGCLVSPLASSLASAQSAGSQGRYTVTVQPPGPGSPAGEIAQGTVNGQAWQLAPMSPAQVIGSAKGCYAASGPIFDGAGSCTTPYYRAGGQEVPAAFTEISGSAPVYLEWAAVAPDVSYLTATLSDGAVLKLRPVRSEGARYVAIAVPLNVLRTVTAYSSSAREIASNSPFSSPVGGISRYWFITWLAAGQHGLARSTRLIGSGSVNGGTWWARSYTGPWGGCFIVDQPGTNSEGCADSLAALAQYAVTSRSLVVLEAGDDNNLVLGAATPEVTRIVVRLPGRTETVRLVRVDGQRYWAFGSQKVLHWTAYDAAGRAVAKGTT